MRVRKLNPGWTYLDNVFASVGQVITDSNETSIDNLGSLFVLGC
jgi:hypothetical protein